MLLLVSVLLSILIIGKTTLRVVLVATVYSHSQQAMCW